MKLLELNEENFHSLLAQHDEDGGNQVNDGLTKLFNSLADENNYYEVAIKVAALNSIYSTAIQYIYPVVDKICSEISNEHSNYEINNYVELIDKISTVQWISKKNGKEIIRCNLSFSSKYVHFLSQRIIPIYDSYIWLVMIGYLNQHGAKNYSYSPPNNYEDFYSIFIHFKETYNLNSYSNYEIDKYLWQYGKTLIIGIIESEGVSMDKAKTELKKRITSALNGTKTVG
ncbi:hypothetical protein AB6C51_00035 [Vibrio splendidus]